MPCDRDATIEKLRKEALARCVKRIEESAAGRRAGANTRTYVRKDYGLTTTFKRAHGL